MDAMEKECTAASGSKVAAATTTTTVTAAARSTYADPEYLRKDIANARRIAADNNFTIVDVTGRAVEETASFITSMLNDRFPGSLLN